MPKLIMEFDEKELFVKLFEAGTGLKMAKGVTTDEAYTHLMEKHGDDAIKMFQPQVKAAMKFFGDNLDKVKIVN